MPRDPAILLADMLEAVERIRAYTDDFKKAAMEDPRTFDAVIRNLEILGEAAKGVPEEQRVLMAEVEWRKLAGLRDVIAHQYFGLDEDILSDVVVNKLPALMLFLRRRLQS